jgi:L-amino acid N-acyltransferase YncA
LYQAFAAAAAAQGADRLKAITSVANTGSAAFHRRLGFQVRQVDDYDGPGAPMMVMTRPLPLPG